MHNSVVCTEDVPFFAAQAVDREKLAATFLGTSQLDALQSLCREWPRGPIDADFHQPLASQVPALLLSGAADPVTPAVLCRRGRAWLRPVAAHHAAGPGPWAAAAEPASTASWPTSCRWPRRGQPLRVGPALRQPASARAILPVIERTGAMIEAAAARQAFRRRSSRCARFRSRPRMAASPACWVPMARARARRCASCAPRSAPTSGRPASTASWSAAANAALRRRARRAAAQCRPVSRAHARARTSIYFARLAGLSTRRPRARAPTSSIELLDMQDIADRRTKGFSQGQKVRTALAPRAGAWAAQPHPRRTHQRARRAGRAQAARAAAAPARRGPLHRVLQPRDAGSGAAVRRGRRHRRAARSWPRARPRRCAQRTGAASFEDAFVALTGEGAA